MEIKYGLISCDDHMQLGKDHWVTHMSKEKWGDDIPQMFPTQAVSYTHLRLLRRGKFISRWSPYH